VKGKWDYLDRLKLAIEDLHKCSACYLRTQLVDETVRDEIVRGEIVWIGDVEVFVSPVTSKPASRGRIKTGHSEAGIS
jgi:hypothetical protein